MQSIIQTLSSALQNGNLAYKVAASHVVLLVLDHHQTVMKLLMLEVDDIVSTFASALPAVIGTIQGVLAAGDEDSLLSLLEDLDSCVESVQ